MHPLPSLPFHNTRRTGRFTQCGSLQTPHLTRRSAALPRPPNHRAFHTALERIWHRANSHGKIMASTFIEKSVKRFAGFPLRSEATPKFLPTPIATRSAPVSPAHQPVIEVRAPPCDPHPLLDPTSLQPSSPSDPTHSDPKAPCDHHILLTFPATPSFIPTPIATRSAPALPDCKSVGGP